MLIFAYQENYYWEVPLQKTQAPLLSVIIWLYDIPLPFEGVWIDNNIFILEELVKNGIDERYDLGGRWCFLIFVFA